MSSLIDKVSVGLYAAYLIARYGLKGAEEKVDKEYKKELMRTKELQDVSEQNKET